MTNCLEEALRFLGDGMSVIPVDGKTKKPLMAWEEFQRRIATTDEVKSWFTKWPHASLGLVTGKVSGVIVVDTEAGADLDLFDLGETPSSKTGGGGRHFFYAYEPLRNAVRFAPLYDFRGDGGYVLVPPSSHPSGNSYAWVDPIGAIPLAPLPDEIRERLKSPLFKTTTEQLLSGIVPEGERNNGAASVAGALLSSFPVPKWETHAWPLMEAWNRTKATPPLAHLELRQVWESIKKAESSNRIMSMPLSGEEDYKPTLRETEEGVLVLVKVPEGTASFLFQDIEQPKGNEVETILTFSFQAPGKVSIPITNRMNIISPNAKKELVTLLRDSFGKDVKWSLVVSVACQGLIEHLAKKDRSVDLGEIPDDEPPVLFPPFLVKGGANILFGDGGTGKTFLALRMAVALATDGEFLGYRPTEPCNVLFVDYEDTERTASYRITAICRGLGIDPNAVKPSIRYFNPEGTPLYLLVPAIKKLVSQHRIGLILVDSVVSACGNEPEGSAGPQLYFNALKKIGISSLSIAHVPKSETNSTDGQGKAYGSVFWHNLARNTWNLQGEEETAVDDLQVISGKNAKQLGLFHRKSNSGKKSLPIAVRAVYGDRMVSFERGDIGFWEQNLPIKNQIIRFVRTKGPSMREEIEQHFGQVPKNTIKSALQRLKIEMILGQPAGQGTPYVLLIR